GVEVGVEQHALAQPGGHQRVGGHAAVPGRDQRPLVARGEAPDHGAGLTLIRAPRSEEHTSELQSRENLVCRLLLEKKKNLLTKRNIWSRRRSGRGFSSGSILPRRSCAMLAQADATRRRRPCLTGELW